MVKNPAVLLDDCRSDGIGRRAGLKIPCPSGRVGSIPTSGMLFARRILRAGILFCSFPIISVTMKESADRF